MSELFKVVDQPTEAPEVSPTPIPEQSPEDKKLAETFQRINKQEAHLKSERSKIEEARKSFEADKQKAERYSQLEGKSPFEILEHFGITYEKLLEADQARRNPIDPTVKRALDEVQQLKTQISSKEQEANRERQERAMIQIKADIAKTIKDHEFDIIELAGAEQAVVDYMEEMYEQTQEILDYKEACQAVADSIAEQHKKLSGAKWLKPKEEVTKTEEVSTQPTTLVNKMTQSVTNKPKVMSEQDRFNAALQALRALPKGTP